MLNPVTVRPAQDADIPAVVGIQERSPEAVPWPADGYRLLLNQGRRLLVAEIDGVVSGFLLYQELPDDEAEILNIAVHPDFRRRGLGRALIERLAHERPGPQLLEVRESNVRARGLYATMGFEEVGRRKGYYHRPVEDVLLLRRD